MNKYSYNGIIITAESKEDAIHKIVADTESISIQDILKCLGNGFKIKRNEIFCNCNPIKVKDKGLIEILEESCIADKEFCLGRINLEDKKISFYNSDRRKNLSKSKSALLKDVKTYLKKELEDYIKIANGLERLCSRSIVAIKNAIKSLQKGVIVEKPYSNMLSNKAFLKMLGDSFVIKDAELLVSELVDTEKGVYSSALYDFGLLSSKRVDVHLYVDPDTSYKSSSKDLFTKVQTKVKKKLTDSLNDFEALKKVLEIVIKQYSTSLKGIK